MSMKFSPLFAAVALFSAGMAQAADLSVNFSGSVVNTCTLSAVSNGTLGVGDISGDNNLLTSAPNESSVGVKGVIEGNCLTSGTFSVGAPTPTSADATAFLAAANAYGSAIEDGGSAVALNASGTPSGNTSVNFAGAAKQVSVHMWLLDTDVAQVPVGTYTYTVTATLTAD